MYFSPYYSVSLSLSLSLSTTSTALLLRAKTCNPLFWLYYCCCFSLLSCFLVFLFCFVMFVFCCEGWCCVRLCVCTSNGTHAACALALILSSLSARVLADESCYDVYFYLRKPLHSPFSLSLSLSLSLSRLSCTLVVIVCLHCGYCVHHDAQSLAFMLAFILYTVV